MSCALALLAVLTFGESTMPIRPTMDEFMGINVHTVQFRPALYQPVARHLRNYHPVEWDLGNDVGTRSTFPLTHNGVNWDDLYGKWRAAGFRTSAAVMFETLSPAQWEGRTKEAEAYGAAFGAYTADRKSVDAAEIGNEPGEFTDAAYTAQFVAMARGIRRAAPQLPIATCAVRVGASGRYHKSVDCVKDHLDLVDILTLHTYSEAEPWPTFRRSYPEDPKAPFLQPVRDLITWRDRYAKGKPIWVTEFGWDASSKTPDPKGEWAKWVGNSETEQAQWLVRAWLEFARLDVARAYQFWFNDNDEAQMHGSSGLTRAYVPKPSFHAVSHLRRALGSYRFARDVVRQEGQLFVTEFVRDKAPQDRCWMVWRPTRDDRPSPGVIPGWRGTVSRAERLALSAAPPPAEPVRAIDGQLRVTASGTPLFVFFRLP